MTDDGTVLDAGRLDALVTDLGEAAAVRGAVEAFLEELPSRLRTLAAAAEDGTPDAVDAAAHALGSPAAMLGAVAVRSATVDLQDAAARDAREDYPGLLDAVEVAAALTEPAMRDWLDASG